MVDPSILIGSKMCNSCFQKLARMAQVPYNNLNWGNIGAWSILPRPTLVLGYNQVNTLKNTCSLRSDKNLINVCFNLKHFLKMTRITLGKRICGC